MHSLFKCSKHNSLNTKSRKSLNIKRLSRPIVSQKESNKSSIEITSIGKQLGVNFLNLWKIQNSANDFNSNIDNNNHSDTNVAIRGDHQLAKLNKV